MIINKKNGNNYADLFEILFKYDKSLDGVDILYLDTNWDENINFFIFHNEKLSSSEKTHIIWSIDQVYKK